MRASRLAFLLLFYVALDFSNPMMPGAVSFDPDECIEGVRAGRITAPAAAESLAPAPARLQPVPRERPAQVRAETPDRPRVRLGHVRRTPTRAPASARSSEDH